MSQKKGTMSGCMRWLFPAFLACLFCALPAAAHPPSDVAVSYDKEKGILTVTITHSVGDPHGHYIDEVTILMQGKPLEASTYTSQPERSTFSYTYEFDGKSGDELTVTAVCNRFGSRSASITLP